MSGGQAEVLQGRGEERRWRLLDKHAAELSEACKAKREAHAKKNAEESAKMGKKEGTHTEPGHGNPPESDTSKIDQPARRNIPSNEAAPQ